MIHPAAAMERVLDKMRKSGHALGVKEVALARAIVEALAEELGRPQPGDSEHLYEQARRQE